jgi:hypothetical protein
LSRTDGRLHHRRSAHPPRVNTSHPPVGFPSSEGLAR